MKNLLIDPWLPIVRKDGSREIIALCNIIEGYVTNPVIDIEVPRPDLRNGIFQLLIGVLQVMAMPEDEEEWEELWEEPYDENDLKKKFLKYEDCFVIDNIQGPAFMQDYDWDELSGAKVVAVSSLLIDAPGVNTIEGNKDHFVKRREGGIMSPYWAAVALYTLQSFAPAGGQGPSCRIAWWGAVDNHCFTKRKESDTLGETLVKYLSFRKCRRMA